MFIRPGLTAGSPPERLNMGERMRVSSVSLFQNTRGGTIIPSRALLLLLVACYHDQNHTHYLVEVIEVVVGGRSRWMSWRRRRWPLPPTCSRYSVCRHYCPHSRHSGLAVCHPVVCYLRPEKRNRFGREEIANNVAKIPRKYVL